MTAQGPAVDQQPFAVNRPQGDPLDLQSFYNKIPAMVCSIDRDDRLIRVNDAWLQALGYTHAEVLGRHSTDFCSEPSRQWIHDLYLPAFFAQGQVQDAEVQLVKKNGELMDGLFSATAERDRQGEIICALVVIQDITARKRVEAALRESQEQLRHLNDQLTNRNQLLTRTSEANSHEMTRRQQVTDSLRDMVLILNSERPLHEILDYIAAVATRLLRTNSGAIFVLQPDKRTLIAEVTRGLPAAWPANLTLPLDRSFLAHALAKKQPYIAADLAQALVDQNIGIDAQQRALVAAHYRTLLAIPLVRQYTDERQDAIYGGIALYFPEERHFTTDELDLAVAFGAQAALAIENAGLRHRAQMTAVMEERSRLARELHDSVTQQLYSLTLLAEGWRRLAKSGSPVDVEEALLELGQLGQQALKEMRLLVHELRPPSLEQEGLLGALHQRLAAVEKRAGVTAQLIAAELMELPAAIEFVLYGIAQEALNNTLKHAAATAVTLCLRCEDGSVILEINDNGKGFDPTQLTGGGLGLVSMRERTAQIGGVLQLQSAPGAGTTVQITVPNLQK
ncbi:MAG: PAS domain S-box protein [Caldilineaceae bacterium]